MIIDLELIDKEKELVNIDKLLEESFILEEMRENSDEDHINNENEENGIDNEQNSSLENRKRSGHVITYTNLNNYLENDVREVYGKNIHLQNIDLNYEDDTVTNINVKPNKSNNSLLTNSKNTNGNILNDNVE